MATASATISTRTTAGVGSAVVAVTAGRRRSWGRWLTRGCIIRRLQPRHKLIDVHTTSTILIHGSKHRCQLLVTHFLLRNLRIATDRTLELIQLQRPAVVSVVVMEQLGIVHTTHGVRRSSHLALHLRNGRQVRLATALATHLELGNLLDCQSSLTPQLTCRPSHLLGLRLGLGRLWCWFGRCQPCGLVVVRGTVQVKYVGTVCLRSLCAAAVLQVCVQPPQVGDFSVHAIGGRGGGILRLLARRRWSQTCVIITVGAAGVLHGNRCGRRRLAVAGPAVTLWLRWRWWGCTST